MPALPLAAGDPISDIRERIDRIELRDLVAGPRELIDTGELLAMDELAQRPAGGLELPWEPARQRMRVSGDVAHWSGDLQARIRRDGLALVEWEGPPLRAHQIVEQLSWAFGRPVNRDPLGAPLVVALMADGAAGDAVLVRASGVWRSLRHRCPADVLEAAAAPDSLIVEVDRRHVPMALLPRLSRTRRGLCFSTACTRVFAAPGVGALFRAIGEVVSDPDLQLRLRLLPGQVLVLDHLSWRIARSAGSLHRVDFASPELAALALGFKAV